MEFLDEDAKPKFMFQSRAQQQEEASQISDPQTHKFFNNNNNNNKAILFICIPISTLLFALTFFFFNSEPINSLLFWLASSLLVGPFAPASLTAGDIRVGQGPIVQFTKDEDKQPQFKQAKKTPTSNFRQQIGNHNTTKSSSSSGAVVVSVEESAKNVSKTTAVVEERDWSEEDLEVLKKQMAKHPVGMPRRWEVITGAFNGSRKLESVVKMAKSMSDKKVSDGDSFARFLKDRKPLLDKRAEEESWIGSGEKEWSAEEDIALLNALKAFQKDVSMRWEKIAAAVPGKTKSACMKRVTELKRDFRNSKSAI